MLKFTSDHEWILVENDSATIGVTQYAQEQLGDLVFVQLPKPGAVLQAGAAVAVVESVKAASDVYAPLSGEITEINQQAVDDPTLVNSDPTGKGWLFKLKLSDRSQLDALMDEAAYKKMIVSN